jgi:hypothetical protein
VPSALRIYVVAVPPGMVIVNVPSAKLVVVAVLVPGSTMVTLVCVPFGPVVRAVVPY